MAGLRLSSDQWIELNNRVIELLKSKPLAAMLVAWLTPEGELFVHWDRYETREKPEGATQATYLIPKDYQLKHWFVAYSLATRLCGCNYSLP